MSGRRAWQAGAVGLAAVLGGAAAWAQTAVERFPPPDFGPTYRYPEQVQGPPRAEWLLALDTAVLVGALALAAWLVHARRSRRGLIGLSIGSILYFGFFRKGCICPIGSIQNVAQGIFDPHYFVPAAALALFALPLLFALFFGRVFCGGVCPMGAVQDLVLVRPLRLPDAFARALGLVRYAYLGLAVLLAATSTSYVICEYDPFIGFFRMGARFHIWLWSGAIVVLSMFVGRPYCRFLCPYSVLLGVCSRFAAQKVRISPAPCSGCDLCYDQCPFNSVHEAQRPALSGKAGS